MKIRKFSSLSFKLTIWYVVILGIIVSLAGLFLYEAYKKSLMDDLDENLREIAHGVINSWWKARGVTWENAIREAEQDFKIHDPFIQVVIMPHRGRNFPEKIFHSAKIEQGSFALNNDLYYKAGESKSDDLIYVTFSEQKISSHPLRTVLCPVRGHYIVQVGISLKDTQGTLRQLLVFMILSALLLLVFASLGGNFIIRKALLPVKNVTQTAKEITADDLSLRIDIGSHRKDEIGALVDTFNNMIARLEKSVKKIRQFSGDVSHELRTPLTIIRGEVEIILRKERKSSEYQKTLGSILEETYHLEKIIYDLLFLARIGASNRAKFNKKIQLDEILLKVFESREQAARKKKIDFFMKKIMPSQIKGDEPLLERLVSNIIDNAIRYTSSGGRVEITLDKNGSYAVLTIRDTGIGIPEESLPFIFDRFYVVEKSRSKETGGSGLGLSIVKSVADIHEAIIDIQSKINQGTCFQVKFPLSEAGKATL